MPAWKYEALFVAIVVSVVAYLSGGSLADWVGAAAVLVTFMHAQISFSFQEAQGELPNPQLPCYRWSGRYFVSKEILWIATFVLLEAWPLLIGAITFVTYPYWRKIHRNYRKQLRLA